MIVPASGAQPAPAAQRLTAKLEHVSVSVDPAEAGTPVPQDFLGLSFEVAALPQLAGYASHGDLVTLLRSLGVGVLRFGGVTADEQIAWRDERTPRPSWALGVLEAGSLWELGSLAQASGWHVLLTLGMGHYAPQAAAREAAVAKAALGSSLEAIELGNEPDAYAAHGLRAQPWTFVQYSEQVSAYRAAIEALAAGIPLAGPDTSGSSAYESWGPGEAVDQRPALLTGHHYPMGCKEQPAPSIARLLSPQIRKLEKRSLHRYLLVADEAGIPFRMDEANTVSCGGVPGISDTFASALWALAYVTRAMSMGAAGINLESNPNNCVGYTLLCALTPEAAADGELGAQPEWYALLLAKALLGERPLPTSISRAPTGEPRRQRVPRPRWDAALRDRRRRPAGRAPRGRLVARGRWLSWGEHPVVDGAIATGALGGAAGWSGGGGRRPVERARGAAARRQSRRCDHGRCSAEQRRIADGVAGGERHHDHHRRQLEPMTGVFVTGGSGFIGGQLIERLRGEGHLVRALARSDAAAEGVGARGAEPVTGELADVAAMRAGADGCQLAFHAAATLGDWGRREEFERGNVEGTETLCTRAGRRRAALRPRRHRGGADGWQAPGAGRRDGAAAP